jgi:hypothetical protein
MLLKMGINNLVRDGVKIIEGLMMLCNKVEEIA